MFDSSIFLLHVITVITGSDLGCVLEAKTPSKCVLFVLSFLSSFVSIISFLSLSFALAPYTLSHWPVCVCVFVCATQNELDDTQIQQAGDDVELPTELAKMIADDNKEEASKTSVLGQLTNIQNVDMDQLKDKAQATLEDLKQSAEKCNLM